MKKIIDRFFRKSSKSDEGDEALVTLIRAAQEDPAFRDQLVAMLSLDEFNRKSILNTFLQDLRFKQAPSNLVSAIARLLDNNVAQKALEILKSDKTNKAG